MLPLRRDDGPSRHVSLDISPLASVQVDAGRQRMRFDYRKPPTVFSSRWRRPAAAATQRAVPERTWSSQEPMRPVYSGLYSKPLSL